MNTAQGAQKVLEQNWFISKEITDKSKKMDERDFSECVQSQSLNNYWYDTFIWL